MAEFHVDNSDGALKPGDYVQMNLAILSRGNTFLVPASALMFRDGGMSVAAVGPDSRIVMKQIVIARDLGSYVEVASGLSRMDRIVDNPPDSLRQGNLVRIAGNGSIQSRAQSARRINP
jgi:multidrug efflux pump subunit AcrA (membrane-fusion protein)